MENTKRSPSLHFTAKIYPLNQSPLFKLKTKKKLLSILGLSIAQVRKLSLNTAFKEFTNNSGREIQEPMPQLKAVHKRIGVFLGRIELPDYLHSGRKRHSNLTNAESHRFAVQLLKLDIHKFFPSTTATKVYRVFVGKFQMQPDIAYLMTNLVTYNGKVPTGSPISMLIAFWANKDMFDMLSCLALYNNLRFTVYVDDVAFSGEKIPKGFAAQVKNCILSHGLISKKEKEKFYTCSTKGKLLTGVILRDGELKVRWAHNASIKIELELLAKAETQSDIIIHIEKLAGKLHAAGQIDRRLKDKARFFTQQLNVLKSKSSDLLVENAVSLEKDTKVF